MSVIVRGYSVYKVGSTLVVTIPLRVAERSNSWAVRCRGYRPCTGIVLECSRGCRGQRTTARAGGGHRPVLQWPTTYGRQGPEKIPSFRVRVCTAPRGIADARDHPRVVDDNPWLKHNGRTFDYVITLFGLIRPSCNGWVVEVRPYKSEAVARRMLFSVR